MKRYGLLIILGMIITTSGCSSKESNVFYVMFKEKPDIAATGVYLNGDEIGEIVSQKSGFNNIHEVEISINGQEMEKMKDDVVFCVSKGRLEYRTFQSGGAVLPKESPVLGFNSNASLYWFKVKNALNNLSMEASENARELYDKIKWAELKAVT